MTPPAFERAADLDRLTQRLGRERAARQEAERIAEASIRDLYDRQNALVLLRSIAYAANEATSVDEAMQAALNLVCRYVGWPCGHVFFVDDEGGLVSSSIWHDDGTGFDAIRRQTEATAFAAGVGLPGEVLLGGESIWIENVRTHDNFPRARGVVDVGVGAAFGMPVVVGSSVRAVLEFFHRRVFAPNPELLGLMEQVGALLGRVIEREESSAALRRSNARLEQALSDLRSAQQAVIQQERLRALGQMASGIAHDFNNALVPIVGFTELILKSPKFAIDTNTRESLGYVLTAARDAAAVVSRLREFYRVRAKADVLTNVALGALARQVVELTRPRWYNEALARGVRIAVETDLSDIPPILGHEPELREAITNLMLNAIDALTDGGTITLRTTAAADQVTLALVDTGIGMSEETLSRCLDPFFTTKGDKGSGLGLGMVYGIVQRHQARLNIDSTLGQGTTISMIFAAAETERPEPPADIAEPTARKLHIVVVDDKPIVRTLLLQMLAAEGHEAEAFESGVDAMARLESSSFDVVITDRAMPAMSGDEIAMRVKQLPRPIPVVMVTGFGAMMESAGERPLGVDAIVPKPVSADALRDALAEVTRPTRRDAGSGI
jgi:signal transduction histidine kinase/ActR/RegA family two-component response regulator